LVLDGAEEEKRAKLRAASEAARPVGEEIRWSDEKQDAPLWARDDEWGNDGLVTVQSAKWGTFLGIMEGCDRMFLILFLSRSVG
jgi:triacylglycerol lipase